MEDNNLNKAGSLSDTISAKRFPRLNVPSRGCRPHTYMPPVPAQAIDIVENYFMQAGPLGLTSLTSTTAS
jgi:hypothetical protein